MVIFNANLKFKDKLKPLNIDNVVNIIIHHIAAENATTKDIHDWHLANGWSGIGYNEYIKKDGSVYICRGDNIGSHCKNENEHSYGIAVEGNYDIELIMPNPQKQALIERIIYNKNRFKNIIAVFPHSYFGDTKCPGKNFPITEILKSIENRKEKKKMFNNVSDALEYLTEQKVINSQDYWNSATKIVINLDTLIVNIANKILELQSLK